MVLVVVKVLGTAYIVSDKPTGNSGGIKSAPAIH